MVFTSNYVSAHETNSTKAPLSRRTTRNHQFPLRNTITSNTNRKRKAAVENDSKHIPLKRARFYGSCFRQQKWSLPDSIIYYISKNPSTSKLYQKLIQSCKYFFIKNPILIVSHLYFQFQENLPNICFNGKRIIDFKKVSAKIWIPNKFAVDIKNSSESNPFSSIFPKIYLSNIKKFTLYNQNILFDNFVLLTSKCENILFNNAFVINDDFSIVVLEKLVQILPNIETFYHENNVTSDIFSSNTVKELLKIPHFSNLTDLSLSDISEDFDIELFYDFVKMNKKTKSDLSFGNEISDAYKSRLQKIVNEIITTKYHDYKIPYIRFLGMSQNSASILYKLCRKRIY